MALLWDSQRTPDNIVLCLFYWSGKISIKLLNNFPQTRNSQGLWCLQNFSFHSMSTMQNIWWSWIVIFFACRTFKTFYRLLYIILLPYEIGKSKCFIDSTMNHSNLYYIYKMLTHQNHPHKFLLTLSIFKSTAFLDKKILVLYKSTFKFNILCVDLFIFSH